MDHMTRGEISIHSHFLGGDLGIRASFIARGDRAGGSYYNQYLHPLYGRDGIACCPMAISDFCRCPFEDTKNGLASLSRSRDRNFKKRGIAYSLRQVNWEISVAGRAELLGLTAVSHLKYALV